MGTGYGRRYGSLLLALALGLLLGACATSRGREIDQSVLQRLKPGQTTEDEVRAMLGPPQDTGREGDQHVLRYRYRWESPFPLGYAWTRRDQRLDVMVGEQNLVSRYDFSEDRAR